MRFFSTCAGAPCGEVKFSGAKPEQSGVTAPLRELSLALELVSAGIPYHKLPPAEPVRAIAAHD
jgi:hypothetical protein